MTRYILRGVLRLAFGLGLLCCALSSHAQSCVTASQVTLTGNLRSANGLPSSNSVITLTPSQAGFIAGCGINLPQAITCGTSVDGSVIQTPNPLTATVNTSSGSGSLPSGTYYTVYEWYDALGHVTLASPETITILSSTGSLVVNPPASGIPSTAVGMDVFIGTSSGGETLQGQTTGSASFVQSSALTSGASPATANNTVCVATANDAVWPTGTGYIATMVDANGNPIPGFPMQWQLMGAGTTINLSNGLPYYHGVVTYPVPVLTAPQNHGVQSITGPLNFSGYNVLNVGKLGVGTSTPGWSIDVTNGLVNSDAGYLVNGAGGTAGQALCSDGTALDAFCTIPTVPTIDYQYVLNGTTAGDAVTQRPYLAVGSGTGLKAIDVLGVGSFVSRTVMEVDGTADLSFDPLVVTAAAAGTSGHVATWDAHGGLQDGGASPVTTLTCSGSCYSTQGALLNGITPVTMYDEDVTTPDLNNNTPTSVTLPHSIPTVVMSCVCSDKGSRVQSGNVQPVGCNVVGLSAPFTTINVTSGAVSPNVSAYCRVRGY